MELIHTRQKQIGPDSFEPGPFVVVIKESLD